ncbi:Inner membrane protein YohK [Hydrogenovibrio crunogenus]|uniref:Inner membrane protein YohK n=1 Tax=Hydrogenovibrio crunogenus TaxID=39765 RepID=A0A4P7P1W5_9GAMM|nr:LrgB family protein [Hydrogenovibrio crunogenus]QBZ83979.1 Inner membrane protein YohK [Hydrogenovibrio crunogenus]RUM90018.1 MAG: LrgB family protein [Thiomicrospira sp.]
MTENQLSHLWVYLSASPLMGLTMTLVAYTLALKLYEKSGKNALLHPVVVAIALLILFLSLSEMSYEDYFEGGQFIHFLLGPATVALAVPLYKQFSKLKQTWFPVSLALFSGVVIGAISSIVIARASGASLETLLSLAPKSVTVPIAMGISEKIGGLPSLTAVLVVVTGILGAIMGIKLFQLLKIKEDSVKGIAMGVTAHGIGTARSFQESSEMGAFSGLAMALSAVLTALILPYLVTFLHWLELF